MALEKYVFFFMLTSFKGQNPARKCRDRTGNTGWILSCVFDSSAYWLASAGKRSFAKRDAFTSSIRPKYHCKYQVTTQGTEFDIAPVILFHLLPQWSESICFLDMLSLIRVKLQPRQEQE